MFEIVNKRNEKIVIPENCNLLSDNPRNFKIFKAYEKYLIRVVGRNGIDWHEMESILDSAYYLECSAIEEYCNLVFWALGFLTPDLNGAYAFSDERMNPKWGCPEDDYISRAMGRLYFTELDDIIRYGNVHWGHIMDEWFVSFNGVKVLEKREICF